MFEGQSIAVFGLGRSGLAVAKAAIARGARVTVYDETPRDRLSKPELVAEAESVGASVVLGLPFPIPADEEFVVVNPAIDHRHPALQAQQEKVIGEIEFAYRISKAPIIAITGTNGKSTTTAMTVVALRAAGVDAVLCGNIFGSGLSEMPLTDAADESTPNQVLVAEVSSFQLEWVREFAPIAAAITTITPDHLDRYDSFEQYAATKERIFERAGVKVDAREFSSREEGWSYVTDGPGALAFTVESVVPSPGSLKLDPAEFKVIGAHNMENVRTAMMLTRAAIEWQFANGFRDSDEVPSACLEALKEFGGLSHRMQNLGVVGGFRFINNSMCTNPAAVVASIQSLGDSSALHVLIGGVNKELPFAQLDEYLGSNPVKVYLFGRDAQQIQKEISQRGTVYDTMKQALDAAVHEAKEGDTVMLAPGCASMDQFRDFRHRGDVFTEHVMDLTK